jgi:DNA invertase Pin-like site-specific DNA recombinase
MTKIKTTAIYARVSTDKQKVEMQLTELRQYVNRRGWKLDQEYIDQGYSGGNTRRPAFSQMLEDAHKRRFDVLLVWKLDRLSRSLKDLITTLAEFGSLGIDFVSYDNGLDTSTPTGKLVFHVVGAVAEFERDIIRERVKSGLENARRKGKKLGRPALPGTLIAKAEALHAKGLSFRKIEKELGLGEGTIRKRISSKAKNSRIPQ